MLKTIEILHFKSIEYLKIHGKRINVFIGEPNTGKSNILEAIGVFSLPYSGNLRELVRFENVSDLFFEKEIKNKIEINTDGPGYSISYEEDKVKINLDYGKGIKINFVTDDKGQKRRSPKGRPEVPFKFYKFKTLEKYRLWVPGH